jgi:mannose-6-phosphate isomerase class I
VVIGTGIGGIGVLSEQLKVLYEKGPSRVNPFLIPMMIPNMASGHVALKFGARGTNFCVVSACSTGAHAIGEGVLILELQEPTDFSVMLEHQRFGLELDHAFLGLDRPLALRSVDHGPVTPERLASLRRRWSDVQGHGPALPDEASDFFCAEVVRPVTGEVTVPAAYAAVVVVDGAGTLSSSHGTRDVRAGDVLLVPHTAGDVTVSGDVTLIRCMPPAT